MLGSGTGSNKAVRLPTVIPPSPKFGAPFTYATFHHERVLAPGQLSYEQMVNVYRHDSIGPETAVYGVIADPVRHSVSPAVHNRAFQARRLDAVYLPFLVAPPQLRARAAPDAPLHHLAPVQRPRHLRHLLQGIPLVGPDTNFV